MSKESFIDSMEKATTTEEIIHAFAEKGITVTDEDLRAISINLGENNELNESALDDISGGRIVWCGTLVAYAFYKVLTKRYKGNFSAGGRSGGSGGGGGR